MVHGVSTKKKKKKQNKLGQLLSRLLQPPGLPSLFRQLTARNQGSNLKAIDNVSKAAGGFPYLASKP